MYLNEQVPHLGESSFSMKERSRGRICSETRRHSGFNRRRCGRRQRHRKRRRAGGGSDGSEATISLKSRSEEQRYLHCRIGGDVSSTAIQLELS
ncbi:hypothetical protein AHAS_Ahas10G0128600 [Arachis hypogaea]